MTITDLDYVADLFQDCAVELTDATDSEIKSYIGRRCRHYGVCEVRDEILAIVSKCKKTKAVGIIGNPFVR
jgi:hypothetical protein